MQVLAVTAIALAVLGSSPAAVGASPLAAPPASAKPDEPTPVAAAIEAFNADARLHPIGKTQPVLTEEELMAVLNWTILEQGFAARSLTRISDPNPTPATFDLLREIVSTRALPRRVRLESMTRYEPNDDRVFDVWSVRVRISRQDGSSFVVSIREQMIGSRAIGEAERAVIQRSRLRFAEGIGSMERAGVMKRYRQERDEALRRDQARRQEEGR